MKLSKNEKNLLVCFSGPHPVILRTNFWVCAQDSFTDLDPQSRAWGTILCARGETQVDLMQGKCNSLMHYLTGPLNTVLLGLWSKILGVYNK